MRTTARIASVTTVLHGKYFHFVLRDIIGFRLLFFWYSVIITSDFCLLQLSLLQISCRFNEVSLCDLSFEDG